MNMVALFEAGAAPVDSPKKQILTQQAPALDDDVDLDSDSDSDSDSDEDDNGNQKVTEGDSPLRDAAKHGDRESLEKILLMTDPDLDLTDSHGDTALTWSCYNDNIQIAEKLIKCGANVEIRNKNGNTAHREYRTQSQHQDKL